ncbi:MAG: T9SS type A sorting domain-containing protein [Flavobacteriales bacterium]
MRRFFLVCVATLIIQGIEAQEFFTLMNYNVLNFPQGEMQNRQDTLQNIINFIEPDLILLQELKSESGLISIAEESCSDLDGNYVAAEWVSQQSNPNSSWPLQQSLVYNSEKFTLHTEGYVTTNIRDINEYVLYFNSNELLNEQDTAFLYVYVAHLKSSQGEENEALRLGMTEDFTAYLETLPSDAQIILGGDFNIYNSDEPAYQELLNNDNNIILKDPIDMPGNWHSSSFPDKTILTQSTRTSQIFGDGSGGGLDDRFDFMLTSENLLNNSGRYRYVENSYFSLGNNGTCYNQSLLNCLPSTTVPESVMRSLYYMSDHLPVIMQIQLDQTLALSEESRAVFLRSNVVQDELKFNQFINEKVEVYTLTGQKVLESDMDGKKLDVSFLGTGMYILKMEQGQGIKFVKEDGF